MYCNPEMQENRNHASAHASNQEHVSHHIYSTETTAFVMESNTAYKLIFQPDGLTKIAFRVFKTGEGPLRETWLKIVFWALGTEGNNLMWAPSDRSEIPLKHTLISFQLCALIWDDHQTRITVYTNLRASDQHDLSNEQLEQEHTGA